MKLKFIGYQFLLHIYNYKAHIMTLSFIEAFASTENIVIKYHTLSRIVFSDQIILFTVYESHPIKKWIKRLKD